MEMNQLEAFVRVVQEGNFTRAGDSLGLTQPSVSARIAGLEKALDGPLFQRGGRHLKLTPLGERFLPYAQRAIAIIADGQQVAENLHTGRLGRVVIAALNTMGLDMLPDPLQRFNREYPTIDMTVKRQVTSEILAMLRDGTATLGLIGAPLFDKNIAIVAHFQEPIIGVVNADHPLALRQQAGDALEMSDIHQYAVLSYMLGPRAAAFVQGVAEAAARQNGRGIVTVPTAMVNRLIISGEAVAFMPLSRVTYQLERERMVALEIGDLPRLYNEPLLVHLRGRELDKPNQAFVQMIRSHWRHILL